MFRSIKWLAWLALWILVFCPSICGADTTITDYDMSWTAGYAAVMPSCNFDLYVYHSASSSSSKIMINEVDPSDQGTTFTANAQNDPGFNSFASYITDGTNDWIAVELNNGSGGYLDGGFKEGEVFGERSPGIYDLKGYTITGVSMKIKELELDIPGTNPSRNGIWTDGTFDFEFCVTVVPEPNTITLLLPAALLGLLFLNPSRFQHRCL